MNARDAWLQTRESIMKQVKPSVNWIMEQITMACANGEYSILIEHDWYKKFEREGDAWVNDVWIILQDFGYCIESKKGGICISWKR